MPLDPAVVEMLQQMADAQGPALTEMSPPDAREMFRAMQGVLSKPKVALVEDAKAGELPVRIYKTSYQDKQPVGVFFHGGGWVIGDRENHGRLCSQTAIATGSKAVPASCPTAAAPAP